MTRRILVAGASGRLGRPVAVCLQSNGYEVRALTREPERCADLLDRGIEVVRADVSDAASLQGLCGDCDGVYISLRGQNDVDSYERCEVQGVANLVGEAKAANVRRIAYLSGAGRSRGNEHHFPVRIKNACEKSLREGGVPYTIFRATHFMESLPLFVRNGRAEILGSQPHRYHYLAVQDYASMVARSFAEPGAANRVLTILGPRPYTMAEALCVYLARVHPKMSIKTVPLPLLRVVATLTGNRDLKFATALFAAFAALGEEGDASEANALLGAPATTLEQWCGSLA